MLTILHETSAAIVIYNVLQSNSVFNLQLNTDLAPYLHIL